jgi:thioesterase domain-containing protein
MEQASLPTFSPLVPLKAGDEDPAVFMAPGVGGSVMEFFKLVANMQTSHPIYGLQAIAADGGDIPFDRIEHMAQFYLEAIQQRQPHGPYLLVGYSLGGLVALEIAQRLSAKGERILLLSLLDAYPYKSYLGTWQRARRAARLISHHASIVKRLPLRNGLSYVLDATERTLHSPSKGSEDLVRGPFISSVRQARDSGRLALTRYRPRPYEGKIRFVKAAKKSVFPVDPVGAWNKWMRTLEVETVPGDHYAMLSEHFDSLASALSRYLQEAG